MAEDTTVEAPAPDQAPAKPEDYQIEGDLGIAAPVRDGDVIKGGDLTNDLRMLTGDRPIGVVVPDKLEEIKANPKWKTGEGVAEVDGELAEADTTEAEFDEMVATATEIASHYKPGSAQTVTSVPEQSEASTAVFTTAFPSQAASGEVEGLRAEVEFYRAAIKEHWESTQTSPRDECDQDLKLWATLERPLP